MKLVSLALLLLCPLLASGSEAVLPVDCTDIHRLHNSPPAGVYTIYPLGENSAIQVLCDVDTEGGWWTTMQKRIDGSISFNRPWAQYKMGFGNSTGEYWIGLDTIHYLTNARNYELMVYMEDFKGKSMVTWYKTFHLESECNGFKLKVDGFVDGGGGNFLSSQNGQKFSTFDQDNDEWETGNCADAFKAGWWYEKCHHANPNGVYRLGPAGSKYLGVEWKHYNGNNYSLKITLMKIRPL